MSVRLALAALLALCSASAPAAAQAHGDTEGADVPVRPAACVAAAVTRVDDAAEGQTAVRAGPDRRFPVLYELAVGDAVFLCERRGEWAGVVFGDSECGLADAATDRPYGGDCPSGWVAAGSVAAVP